MSALTSMLVGAKSAGKFKKKANPKNGPSSGKAAQMLKDNSANGKALTDKQKRYFGFLVGKGQ